ncbi:hypothetical protein [Mucilaginibacter boryungensis]|uniref:Uncharacterized protein n=1 Tax=Mucilaginibacter boryungensis TaxID=768480 RepID=A0ABR9XFJ6_9SPHI|nr:hypothetical protein [Mucilaginibacter boryungensis]MBE9666162.1 hypothetical protein [Mucilaginibacter boryungensis]
MRTLKITIVIILFFAANFACKKNQSKETSVSEKLTVVVAEAYYNSLDTKYGNYDTINIAGKTEKILKKVDFSKAYVGENKTSFFVEVPITYTRRSIILKGASGITSVLKEMAENSFDRLVIYKDKVSGMVTEKIMTIMPTAEYLTKGYKGLHDNHFLNMSKDFSGYVTYKSWKGKFLSTQSYNLGGVSDNNRGLIINKLKIQTTDSYESCVAGVYYFMYWNCDYDQNGDPVNCEQVVEEVPAQICTINPPNFSNGESPIPTTTSDFWTGWPEPQDTTTGECPGARYPESPIMWAAASGSNFSMTLYQACTCYGYSWVIFEDTTTGDEYSVPISNQQFLLAGCTVEWETHFQIPTTIPNGQYYVKVNLDGDVFYFQLQSYTDGTILKRYVVPISR